MATRVEYFVCWMANGNILPGNLRCLLCWSVCVHVCRILLRLSVFVEVYVVHAVFVSCLLHGKFAYPKMTMH